MFYSASHGEMTPLAKPLSAFPLSVGDWQMKQEGVIDDETKDILKADDLLFHLGGRYKADSMPAPQKVDRGGAIYEMSATQQGDGVEVKRSMTLKSFLFGKEVYPALRSFFSLVKTDDDAQVLLQSSPTAKNN